LKFCYLDETGTGQETVVIFVGVVADAQRMHRTKREWSEHLQNLSTIAGKKVQELHATELYSGNNEWRSVDGTQRHQIIEKTLEWLASRKHKIIFSAVCKKQFEARQDSCVICQSLHNCWHASAFHVVLSLQKAHKNEGQKGHIVMVFDRGKGDQSLPDLLFTPPDWSETYYEKEKKKPPLDHIVDVPFFADSKQVALIQIADLIGFILRRYSDMKDYGYPERYTGEMDRINAWIDIIKPMLYKVSTRYPKKSRCTTADVFFNLAPESLRML
jgi:hypothetical protein